MKMFRQQPAGGSVPVSGAARCTSGRQDLCHTTIGIGLSLAENGDSDHSALTPADRTSTPPARHSTVVTVVPEDCCCGTRDHEMVGAENQGAVARKGLSATPVQQRTRNYYRKGNYRECHRPRSYSFVRRHESAENFCTTDFHPSLARL
jgi:hypothetical protein